MEEKDPMPFSPYLSITYTEYVNGKNIDNGMVMRSMIYDLHTKEIKKLTDIPYTSQSPLSVISKTDNKVYYSADGGGKGDQLFSYDLTSHKEEKLTDDIFAINYIVPTTTTGQLVLAAAQEKGGNLKTIFLNNKTDSLKVLHDKDTDTSTWCVTYNDKNKSIYTAEYSKKAQFEARELAGKKQKPTVPPDYVVKEINTETLQEREVIRLKNEQVISLTSSNDQLFMVTSHYYNRGENEYNFVDIQTGKRTKLKLSIHAASSTAITEDNSELYYLGGPSGNDKRGIYLFDFKSNKSVPIFMQADGFINEFSLISTNSNE
ncbi:hypothetical protein [Paenibacillus sp.]|jgi:hypothetical protein|uniref:hypothetical protein n=1 Tax=Paenibacillus sp. TaxID=58172 RepID=UPI002824748B|nr:hypothetical protein [Paenibacillus sp.]MDR0268667.1 hypothetical protein [Paenibacillus sp.]